DAGRVLVRGNVALIDRRVDVEIPGRDSRAERRLVALLRRRLLLGLHPQGWGDRPAGFPQARLALRPRRHLDGLRALDRLIEVGCVSVASRWLGSRRIVEARLIASR